MQCIYNYTVYLSGVRSGAVGLGTALQVRRSRVGIFHNPSDRTMAL